MFLDRNGSNVQRRKMYIGVPIHNMKSNIAFDWQNNDPSIQDQMGKKYKLAKESKQIRQKYSQKVDQEMKKKYIQLNHDDIQSEDILAKEVDRFNHSKIITTSNQQEQEYYQKPQKFKQYVNRLNQSLLPQNYSPTLNSSRNERQIYLQSFSRDSNNQNYNPQNYYTINPTTDRYKSLESVPNYELGSSPSKFVEKMYTGTAINQYPFRNVIPDKLETHLRPRAKAQKKKVDVSLNLFDYYTRT